MSTKHTPGPWAIGYTSAEKDPFVVTADDGTKYHRRVMVAVAGPSTGVGEYMAHANAALIAAAPELLEALEEIARGVGPFSMDRLEHATNTIEAMKGLARAAIAKARGES